MVVMRMREHHHIQMLDSARPEIRRHHLLAHVEPRTLTADPFRSRLPAAVNQHRSAIRKRSEYRVALSHIKHAYFQLAAIQHRRERMCRDERRQRAERNDGRPFERSNWRRELAADKAIGSERHHSARSNGHANQCKEKAAISQIGGPGMRYDMRGHAPTHFTTARSDATRKPSMRASSRDKRPQTNVATSVRKPSGTINPVRTTAGILLRGPARLTR